MSCKQEQTSKLLTSDEEFSASIMRLTSNQDNSSYLFLLKFTHLQKQNKEHLMEFETKSLWLIARRAFNS